MFDLSETEIEYRPAFNVCNGLLNRLSVIVNPGPTVPTSLGGAAAAAAVSVSAASAAATTRVGTRSTASPSELS